MMREETLAERVALSVLKGGEVKGTNAEKVLINNEFSCQSAFGGVQIRQIQ